MKRRFKSKKRKNFIPIIIFIILFFSIYYLIAYVLNIKVEKPNNEFVNTILENNVIEILNNNIKDLFKPKNILNFEIKTNNNKLLYKSNNIKVNNDNYKIYIYNSHQNEEYSNEYLIDYNIVPTVLTADYILEEKLENIGINTLVEESNIVEYMKKNNMNHAASYKASRLFLKNTIDKYPNIDLYIDLHRDAISHKNSIVNINNKVCAKILFVLGLENPNYKSNLENIERLNNIINEKYPGLSRGITKKQGAGVNGVYNQDLKNNVILIEIGGNENNIEEINNTLEYLSLCIGEYINEKK